MSRKSRTQQQPPQQPQSSVVVKLIEQRRLIQEWLAKLAAGGAETMPAHVVERVRNDYTARLASVTRELGEHADGVRQSLDDQQARHAQLEKDQARKRDELSELRLRRQVGEIEEGRFKDQSQKLKSAIEDLGRDIAASARDIDRLEEILDSMERTEDEEEEAAAPAEAVVEEAPEEAPKEEVPKDGDEASEPVAVAPPASPKAPEAAAPPPPPPPPPPVQPAPAPAPAAAEAPKEAPKEAPREPAKEPVEPPAPAGDEMSFLRSVTGVIGAVKPPAAKDKPASAEAEKPFYVLEQMPQPEVEGKVRASKSSEGERTLVCAECGTKNLPTEWYCEKCGAELTNF